MNRNKQITLFLIALQVLTIIPLFLIQPAKAQTSQDFYFAGPFDELGIDNTGHKPCVIQAHYFGTTEFDEVTIYTDDGDWSHFIPQYNVEYFSFNFTSENATSTSFRQFWIDQADPYYAMGNGHSGAGELNVYNQTIYQYTIRFAATSGEVIKYPYVTIYDQAGNAVERRKMDAQYKIQAGLMLNQKYSFSIGIYSIGDYLTTSDLSPEIVIPALTFPDPVNIGFLYVKAYADRDYSNSDYDTIRFVYDDVSGDDGVGNTNTVYLYIYFQNDMTIAKEEKFVSTNSIAYSWVNADKNTDYYLIAIINHNYYGRLDYRIVLPRSFSNASPWGLDFLGTLPFNSAYLIPSFILLVVAGIFSTLNAPVGLLATVVTATFLSYEGWLPIGVDVLVFCFALVFIFGIVMARRRYYG